MSVMFAFSMFFLSFLPLWIAVIFINGKSIWEGAPYIGTEIVSIALILIASVLSVISFLVSFYAKSWNGAQKYTMVSATEEKTTTSEFLLSYILPLFAFDFSVWHETVLFLIFFATFAFLCIRHSRFSVNLVLELLRYRIYSCKLESDGVEINKTVISKSVLETITKSEVCIHPINNEYAVHIGY